MTFADRSVPDFMDRSILLVDGKWGVVVRDDPDQPIGVQIWGELGVKWIARDMVTELGPTLFEMLRIH